MKSQLQTVGGVPALVVNGEVIPQTAYMTYYTERGCYADFQKIGYNLFSVSLSFSSQTINEATQSPPFCKGIYDGVYDGEKPNYTSIDQALEKIVTACPNAYIFPRVNVSLPKRWEEENVDELCDFGYTEHRRACFSSEKWAEEVKRLLRDFIAYIESSTYKDHVIGYQLAGGNTEEWFSFDLKGSIGKRSREGFERYCQENNIENSEANYYAYLSEVVAGRLCEFAGVVKECVQNRLVVGVFYGYTLECPSRTSCHHALDKVLESENIDFICSPVSYANFRSTGMDHVNMLPLDSLKLHGKLYFAECDQRTHLTRPPNALPAYNTWIWQPTEKESTLEILKLLFARALTHGHAMWWFDMWGGWYADAEYLSLMKRAREIAVEALPLCKKSSARVAVFIDEKGYAALKDGEKRLIVGRDFRHTLGLTGVPYDIYLLSDFDRVAGSYDAVVFLVTYPTEGVLSRIERAKKEKIPAIVIDESNMGMSVEELRALYQEANILPRINRRGVVYESESHVFLHTAEEGEYSFEVGGQTRFVDEFTKTEYVFPTVLKKGVSLLFKKDKKKI
ncbi:MAG: hypothetical protein IJX81_03995 [Clostridia bacterium]|nr:hypothetical protein [Clostridia bacterium]